jgi:hypothetical protein
VPVTARLSRKFYERFGDDIAGEFVDWFNAVDATYHQQLREHNDLNWERFKGELHSAIAQSEGRMMRMFSEQIAVLKAENSETKSELKSEIAGLRTEMSKEKADLMKWMFIYWSGTVLTLGGLMVAVLTVVLRR